MAIIIVLIVLYLMGVLFALMAGFKWTKNIPPNNVTPLERNIVIGLAFTGSWISFFGFYLDEDYPK